ncbi:MAG: histidinol-phosphatase HisJ [Acidobacteriota bacterium]
MPPKLRKRDGHTHTQFCAHGSGEATRAFVEQAVARGFETYSLTEHPPLPSGFRDPAPDQSCGMSWDQLEPYLEHSRQMKARFSGKIDVRVGLEVDFIPGFESETRELLRRCEGALEDAVLSVHFLPGKGGWRCVDFSAEDFQDGLVEEYGSVEAVHQAYWAAVKQAVTSDLGPSKPKRLGHLSLIHKFQLKHPLKAPLQFRPQVLEVLDLVQERGMELDLNAAGLFKPDCREIYPAPWIVAAALRRGIPLVYGSDTHSVKGVGQGFEEAQSLLQTAWETAGNL